MINVALYARCSSDMQAEKDLSVPAQLRELREYAQRQGWTIYREYVDEGRSALSADREAFQEMIADATSSSAPFTRILVWEFSRFARNQQDSVVYKALLRRHGIEVLSMTQTVDDSPAGRLTEGMLELIDAYYSLNLAKQIHRGQKENTLRGYANGGRPPFGLRAVKVQDGGNVKTRWEPDPDTAPVVLDIFQMADSGKGLLAICEELNSRGLRTSRGNLWGKTSLHSILTNERYLGKVVWNRLDQGRVGVKYKERDKWVEVEAFEPIVPEELFRRVRSSMQKRSYNSRQGRAVVSPYLLSGLIHCSECGALYVADRGGSNRKSRVSYYMCGTYRRRGRQGCASGRYNTERLDRMVIDLISDVLLSPGNLTRLEAAARRAAVQHEKERTSDEAALQKQLQKADAALRSYYTMMEADTEAAPALLPRVKELQAQKAALDAQMQGLSLQAGRDKGAIALYGALRERISDIRQTLASMEPMEMKNFLSRFIADITAQGNTLTVRYIPALLLPPAAVAYENKQARRDNPQGPVVDTVGGAETLLTVSITYQKYHLADYSM